MHCPFSITSPKKILTSLHKTIQPKDIFIVFGVEQYSIKPCFVQKISLYGRRHSFLPAIKNGAEQDKSRKLSNKKLE
jgi:hypothetical protein